MKHHLNFLTTLAALALLASSWADAEIVISTKPAAKPKEGEGIAVPAPGGETEALRLDTVEFLNGDKLHGTFLSIDPQHGVRWRHPAVRQVMEIEPSSVGSVNLDRPPVSEGHSNETCLVQLSNEDELQGRLVSLDTNAITLETWYAGTLTIPRAMARSLNPGKAPSTAIYEGPTSLDGWTVKSSGGFQRGAGPGSAAGWKYRNGAFYGAGNCSAGKDMNLPPRSNIEFDLSWRGYLQMAVSFYADKLERYGGDCYMLQLNTGSIYLQRMSKDGNSSNFGHSEASALAQKSKVHISVRSNKEQKTISLLIDGAMVKQWNERGDFSTGSGLVFFQQGAGVVKISSLRISEWDGKFDDQAADAGKLTADLVKLGNKDKISGTLKSIRNGKLSFGTEFATLEIPIERVAEIELANPDPKKPEHKADEIRAVFADRGSVTFQIEQWDDQQVNATSPNFGQVKFLPSAFSRIDFNLDKHRSDEDPFDFGEGFSEGQVIIDQ
jgi:hypothetical protein